MGHSLTSHIWHVIIYRFQVSQPTSLLVINYLLFLVTTVDVEQVFSQGWLVLSHIHSHLSIQSTHALLCLRAWCQLRLVNGHDLNLVLGEEVIGEEEELPSGWDTI